MAILRLSTPEGHPLPPDPNMPREIGRILLTGAKFVVLSPGEYDLTPQVWTEHNHEHQIIVHYDGTGTYRMLPRSDGAEIREHEGGYNEQAPRKGGGSNIKLPEDSKLTLVTGGMPDGQEFGLFEVLVHSDLNLRTILNLPNTQTHK